MDTQFYPADEAAMMDIAESFAEQLEYPCTVFLTGDLGAGKTTFVRGVLSALGYTGLVKSPTFSLVETYDVAGKTIHHLDLYRITDPEELEYIGFRDLEANAHAMFLEWPERAMELLPEPDWQIRIDYAVKGRILRLDTGTKE